MYIRNVNIIEDAFNQIQQHTGIGSIEEIVTTFIKADEQNYALYNYVNQISSEIDMIEEQNKKGGLLGKKIEPVVVDPASNWPLFAEKTRELIEKEEVDVIFGCWTSVSRKSVLPVIEELNGLLFYPVQYEGEESSKNVFYTGAATNQQAIPAVDYLMNEVGVKRWVLAGTDYVYPRTTNKILEAYLKDNGVAQEDIMINYTPFGHSDWQTIVSDVKKFGSAGKKTGTSTCWHHLTFG